MNVREGRAVRRLWVVLEDGDSVVEAFAELAREHDITAGWARGVGTLRAARIEGGRALRGALTLVSLEATIGPEGRLVASIADGDGALIAGTLVDAAAERVELWVEPFEGPTRAGTAGHALDDEDDEGSTVASTSWTDVAAASAASEADAAPSWGEVAAASANAAARRGPAIRLATSAPAVSGSASGGRVSSASSISGRISSSANPRNDTPK